MASKLPLALWRFDEVDDIVRPADAMGNVDDLVVPDISLATPPIVDAALGRGRWFDSSAPCGYQAQDKVSGTTLIQRDMSIQVALHFSFDGMVASGSGNGVIYCRGLGNSTVERVSAGLQISIINSNPDDPIVALQWFWQNAAGADKADIGAWFVPSTLEGDVMLLTATRRWVAPDTVVLRYYLGDKLINETTSVNGGIPGGTTGTTTIGCRYNGVAYGGFLDAVIDELRIVDRELAAQEIAATWRRITVDQPSAYEIVKQLHDPGFPISDDASSRVQRETRQASDGLGFMLAQAQNVHDNGIPGTAYGPVLEQWEGITKARAPLIGDSNEVRNARVVARIRQRGVSIPGIGDALADLLATVPANLDVFGFTQDATDDFSVAGGAGHGIDTPRWQYDPSAQWTWDNIAENLKATLTAAAIPFDGTTQSWYTARTSIGNSRAVHLLAKITLTTFNANTETGFFFGNFSKGDFFLVSLAYASAGNVAIKTEVFFRWVSQGVVTQVASIPWTTGWLHVFLQDDPTIAHGFAGPSFRKFTIAWSTTSAAGPYTSIANIAMSTFWCAGVQPNGTTGFAWVGLFVRTVGGSSTALVRFDDVRLRTPYSERALRFFVYRDPTIPGSPDYEAAQHVLDSIAQAHTVGKVIRSLSAICDDPNSPCDGPPCA